MAPPTNDPLVLGGTQADALPSGPAYCRICRAEGGACESLLFIQPRLRSTWKRRGGA